MDPLSGQQWWFNELPGMGTGVASLASVRGVAGNSAAEAGAEEEQRRRSE